MTLIPHEDLARSHAHYLANQAQIRPKTKTRAEILVEIAAEFPDATVAELAAAAERSPSWVRKHLKQAGIVLAKPARGKKVEVRP